MNIKLPENVLNILRILKENDREGFAVGGCIRDLLMGIEPHDYDITTDATPEEIRAKYMNAPKPELLPPDDD